jgi:hypothetical protein
MTEIYVYKNETNEQVWADLLRKLKLSEDLKSDMIILAVSNAKTTNEEKFLRSGA